VPPLRHPIVAGQFYEANAEALKLQIESCFLHPNGPKQLPKVNFHQSPQNIIGLICPHAGYIYSGPVAAWSFFELAKAGIPKTIIILCPNHTGYGSGISIMREGTWQTPLGNIQIDTELSDTLLTKTDLIDIDETAHQFEHSIEVQLPFLQYLYNDKFKIVPICFSMQDYQTAIDIGNTLIKASTTHNFTTIASSDLTHYEPAQQAKKKDHSIISAITNLDVNNLYKTIQTHNITACGYGPIATLTTYAKGLNTKAELLSYHNSGDTSKDYTNVVGYTSIIFKKH